MTPSHLSLLRQQPTEGYYNSRVFAPTPLPVRTFLPVFYEPNYAYPLIVFLHGHGSNEDQVLRYAPHISRRNFISISLRGSFPVTVKKSGQFQEGFSWGPDAASAASVEDYLFSAIEKTQDSHHIHSKRIFLAGFCEGANLAYRMAIQYPEKFAGMMAFNGCMPRKEKPLWRISSLRNLKVFVGHGIANSVVPIGMALEDRKILQLAGIDPTWRTYGTNHRIHLEMLKDANRWIMGHIEKDRSAPQSHFIG